MGFFTVLAFVILVLILRTRDRGREEQARLLQRYGFGLMAVVGVFFALFIAGETAADPGGWLAVGLITAWGLPLIILCLLAHRRPATAVKAFLPLGALVIGLNVWAAVDPRWWSRFEDNRGPVRFIAAFALVLPVVVLGLRRPREAGLMLVGLAVVPSVLAIVGRMQAGDGPPAGPFVVLGFPWIVTGALYLISARLSAPRTPNPEEARRTPHIKAA